MNEMRMGEDDGFKITDLRLAPVQIAKLLTYEMMPGKPIGNNCREAVEQVSFLPSSKIFKHSLFLYPLWFCTVLLPSLITLFLTFLVI